MTLEVYENFAKSEDAILPHGWTRFVDSKSSGVYFRHTSDTITRFKHPVPTNDTRLPLSFPPNNWSFLSCRPKRTFFLVGAILSAVSKARNVAAHIAAIKTSVFELPQFTDGPKLKDICDVICLEDKHGRSAGQLWRMDSADVLLGEKIELVAISSGPVSFTDLGSASEDSIDRKQGFYHHHSQRWIDFERKVMKKDAGTGTFVHFTYFFRSSMRNASDH